MSSVFHLWQTFRLRILRPSREMTGLERKRSACQYKTGQDWNRGQGIVLAMQSMPARYVTKLSPGHFAVWFHLQSPAHAAKARFPLPPYDKKLQPPSIRLHTRARDARKKKDQGKSHWPQKVSAERTITREENQPIWYSSKISTANAKARKRGWQRVLLLAVCPTSCSPHNIPDQSRLADIPSCL